jgi:hypothetical protein
MAIMVPLVLSMAPVVRTTAVVSPAAATHVTAMTGNGAIRQQRVLAVAPAAGGLDRQAGSLMSP